MEKVKREARNEALREAAQACSEEALEDPQTDEDIAYDRAVFDCISAIRKLMEDKK